MEEEAEEVHADGPVIVSTEVNPGRVRLLKQASQEVVQGGPVVYWMSRDQRSRDNWALLYAAQCAQQQGGPLCVAFNLVDSFLHAEARHFGFMLRGLRVVHHNLSSLGIPFFLLRGKAEENIPAFVERCGASILVMDFSPLRIGRVWREGVCKAVPSSVSVFEVDAHNVVPVWVASDKQEYAARTIRGKIQRHLPEYLVEYPPLVAPIHTWTLEKPANIDWDLLIDEVAKKGAEGLEVKWCESREDAAMELLLGKKKGFLTTRIRNYADDRNDPSKPAGLSGLSPYLHYGQVLKKKGFLTTRIRNYADDRNDPSKPAGLSGLSPYLHYGQVLAQRCALEGRKLRRSHTKAIDTFLEELVIRRELADNFCYYQPNYDSLQGAYEWARSTLLAHASDKREHLYTQEELEKGKTHDELWNASQLEMVHLGKMHGFMRMYWAKKILEWTGGPEEALAVAIYLNDKYELDGRDPNGYVGCMWSICGIHDQGWQERPVFGKIRYMNYNGCKRKFNVDGYIQYVKRMVAELKRAAKDPAKIPPSSTPAKKDILE
uniref:Deoxyribodipyrimidine photo-lyase n=1 Tax=Pityrogramma austroamericana TaxID=170714 RepID=Q6WS77_9MONI|nr:type II CPD DNA photolyase [Pityrogramma austroamericana]